MIKRTFIGIAWAVGGVAALVVISIGIMAWRLSSGPVSLGVLTPVMELALNTISGPLRVAVDDTVLTWDRSDGILDVRLVNARAESSNEEMVVSVPELSVDLKVDALARGVIAPTRIEVVRPDLRVVRPADDTSPLVLADTDENAGSTLSALMSALAEMRDPASGMQSLTGIRVVDGSLDVEDRKTGLSWRGTLNNTRLWREPSAINFESSLSVASDGEQTELAIVGEFIPQDNKLSAGLTFTQFRPAILASLGPFLGSLAAIDLPVRGTLSLLADGDGTIEDVGFDFLGGVGHLALPVDLAQELGVLPAAQRLAVRGVELNGTYKGQKTTVDIGRLSIDLGPGETVYLPPPLDHQMPLSAIRARGQYFGGDNRAELTSLELDLDGPEVVISGTAEGLGTPAGLNAKAKVTAKNIQTDDMGRYWPSSVATNANEWCIEHLSDGSVTEARIDLTASGNPDDIEITSLSGSMDIKGVSVDYLPPMPKARNASGVGVFDLNSLTITINGAEAAGVSVRGGTAKLYDFDQPQEKADIDLSIAGPIPKVLALIDNPPLGYAKAMDLDPRETRGSASGRVRLQFPLIVDLPLDQLRVSAQAKLEKVFVAKIALGTDVTDGTLALDLNEKGMDVTGPIVVHKTPARVVWRENFETAAPFDTRLVVDIDDAKISLLSDLKLQAAPVIENYVKGPLGIHVVYVAYPSGKDSVEIKADAKRATVVFPYFDWQKPAGESGSAEFKATLQNERLTEVSSFVLKSQGLDIRGGARYTAGGELESVKLSHIAVGRTNMDGILAALPGGGWDIVVGGEGFDLGPLIEDLQKPDTEGQPEVIGETFLSITADIDTVWIDPKHPLKDVSATIVRRDDLWNLVQVVARVGNDTPLSLSITSGKGQSRTLQVRSSDAGDTLRGLGVFEHMIGGKLKINGTFDDTATGNPLTGNVKVTDYRIANAPGVAKILSIMALTGILDQLRGKGIGFAILDAPFTLHNDVLEIKNARASGTELGMTAEGRVANNTANIKGTIVPFYAANSALGKIPIIGPIFSGGDKGGGLLAARYSIVGPMDDPNVTVNPLSMLTPGFLRNLFDFFDPDSSSSSSTGKALPREPEPEHP